MKKYYFTLLILFISSVIFSQIVPTGTINITTRGGITTTTTCNAGVTFDIAFANTSSVALPITVVFNTIRTPVGAVILPTGGTLSSTGTIYTFSMPSLAPLSTKTISFTLSTNCDDIQDGSLFEVNNLVPTCTLSVISTPDIFTKRETISIPIRYANLYRASTSNMTSASHLGATVTRSLTLESAGDLANFNGFLRVTDNITNGCDMYEITGLRIIRVNALGTTRTTLVNNVYTTPIVPSATSFYTSSTPINFNRSAGEYIVIEEDVRIIPDVTTTCIRECTDHIIESDFTVSYGCGDILTPATYFCKNIIINARIRRDANQPVLTESILAPTPGGWDNTCLINPASSTGTWVTHTKRITNTGNANAYTVNLLLNSPNTTEVVKRSSISAILRNASGVIITTVPVTTTIVNYNVLPLSFRPTCINTLISAGITLIESANF